MATSNKTGNKYEKTAQKAPKKLKITKTSGKNVEIISEPAKIPKFIPIFLNKKYKSSGFPT